MLAKSLSAKGRDAIRDSATPSVGELTWFQRKANAAFHCSRLIAGCDLWWCRAEAHSSRNVERRRTIMIARWWTPSAMRISRRQAK